MFSIEIRPQETGDIELVGEIRIRDFRESFMVGFQDAELLRKEWLGALGELLTSSQGVSLRTCANLAWVLYPVGENVYVQQQLLVSGWGGQLDAEGHIISVPSRVTISDDGEKISEWQTTMGEIATFIGGAV